jgi:hypothetical protein
VLVWAAGGAVPRVAQVVSDDGRARSSQVVVPVGAGGRVSLLSTAATSHVAVDVLGWLS